LRKEILMRKFLALTLLSVLFLLVLVPSSASAHHHQFDGLRIKDEVYCNKFRDDPSGPVTDVTFEGHVFATEKRDDVRAVKLTWRLYFASGTLIREWDGPESPRQGAFGVDVHAFSEEGSYLTATVRFKRPGRRDILHTREVARWPAGREICY
jgi:hypothetical protein